MSNATGKARFFLEQSVPELQELEQKEVFTREEVASIVKKRSDFEHKINARGSKPSDYARYAEYEMNLESLRRKRTKRLGARMTLYNGQRRIFFVLDRATRRFHGDIGLWMQYIEYARREKANKKLGKILEAVLRLHPTKAELWIYAARYAMDSQGSMVLARTYMQKGIRFCRASRVIWVEYAKLETIHMANLHKRRQTLGLDQPVTTAKPASGLNEHDADIITLPDVTAEDMEYDGKHDEIDVTVLQKLSAAPALTGAIPIAIFDAAMRQLHYDEVLATQFFDMLSSFENVPGIPELLRHVLEAMTTNSPDSTTTAILKFKVPLVGVQPSSTAFPSALGASLQQIRSSLQHLPRHARELSEAAIELLLPILCEKDLDPGIARVVRASIRQFARNVTCEPSSSRAQLSLGPLNLFEKLLKSGRENDAKQLRALVPRDRIESVCAM